MQSEAMQGASRMWGCSNEMVHRPELAIVAEMVLNILLEC